MRERVETAGRKPRPSRDRDDVQDLIRDEHEPPDPDDNTTVEKDLPGDDLTWDW